MALSLEEKFMLSDLESLISVLSASSIEFIILKGYVVKKVLFEEHLSYRGCDLDILIHKEDMPNFSEAVSKIGYVRKEFKDRREEEFALSLHSSVSFYKRDSQARGIHALDLHWDITNPPDEKRYFVENMWKGSRMVRLGESEFRILSNEDLLIYLCYHLTRHVVLTKTSANMRWLVEIASILKKYAGDLDWRYILSLTEREGLETILYFYLKISEEKFGVALPDYASSNLRPKWHKGIIAKRELDFENSFKGIEPRARAIRRAHLITGYLFSRDPIDYLHKLSAYLCKKFFIHLRTCHASKD